MVAAFLLSISFLVVVADADTHSLSCSCLIKGSVDVVVDVVVIVDSSVVIIAYYTHNKKRFYVSEFSGVRHFSSTYRYDN